MNDLIQQAKKIQNKVDKKKNKESHSTKSIDKLREWNLNSLKKGASIDINFNDKMVYKSKSKQQSVENDLKDDLSICFSDEDSPHKLKRGREINETKILPKKRIKFTDLITDTELNGQTDHDSKQKNSDEQEDVISMRQMDQI